jgi:hypothetical protein
MAVAPSQGAGGAGGGQDERVQPAAGEERRQKADHRGPDDGRAVERAAVAGLEQTPHERRRRQARGDYAVDAEKGKEAER